MSSLILQFNCIPIDYDKYSKQSQNKTEHIKYMIAEYGETEETTAIINYFGYTDFDNPRIAR